MPERDLFVLFVETFLLLCDKFLVVKVVDAHGMAHLGKGLCTNFACLLRSATQHFVDLSDVAFQFLAACADGFKTVIEDIVEELLACAVTKTATCVVAFISSRFL